MRSLDTGVDPQRALAGGRAIHGRARFKPCARGTDRHGLGSDLGWRARGVPGLPRATPADDAATEVASATLALEGADARTVAGWMQTELERATYATEALNGPLEDGSFVLDSEGASDCRIQVAVAPLGGLTTITVRYGGGCPAP